MTTATRPKRGASRPSGGDRGLITCTRPSTVSKALDASGDGLMDYGAAVVLQTVVAHPDLLVRAKLIEAGAHWREFKPIVTEAKARRGKREANEGTNIHAVVQAMIEGRNLGGLPSELLDPAKLVLGELEALGVEVVFAERFVANLDKWGEPMGGTTDLVVRHEGRLYVADIKTVEVCGRNASLQALAWVLQTTIYSHCSPFVDGYEPEREPRWNRPMVDPTKMTEWPQPMDTANALVIEVARDGSGVASHELDLDPDLVALALKVRAERKRSRL